MLILKHRERTVVPGGGGNAIMNLASLGVKVLPVGVVGDDEPGELLLAKFRETKISTDGITRLKGHVTTTKTRILAGMSHTSRQQVVRVDREPEPIAADNSIVTKIVKSAREYVSRSKALLVSDYGYGAATPHFCWCKLRRRTGRTTSPSHWIRDTACSNIPELPLRRPTNPKSKKRCR